MKNTSFENNLKSLSQDFVVDVNQQQFERVMKLRKQHRKRKMLLWLTSTASVLLGTTLFMLPINHLKQTTNKVNKSVYAVAKEKTSASQPQTSISNANQKVPQTSNTILNLIEQVIRKKEKDEQLININTSNRNNTQIKPIKPTTSTPLTHQYLKNYGKNSYVTYPKFDSINQMVECITVDKPIWIDFSNTSLAHISIESSDLPLSEKTFESMGHKKKSKLVRGVYVHASYIPFLSAKNTSSMLFDKKAEKYGLSEDANFGYVLNAGVVLNLNSQIQLLTGVGLGTIRFDEIRIADISIDTMSESLVTNASNTNYEDVADFSFTRVEVPISVRYIKPIKNNFNGYVQVGFNYGYLVQYKSYVFNMGNDSSTGYRLESNYSSNRINKHQLTIATELGVLYNLGDRVSVNLGVPFYYDLFKVYNQAYAERNTFKLLGLKAGIQFNF